MKEKPVTPYARLLAEARQFAFDQKHRTVRRMWSYPKERLADGWALVDLQQRVAAAEQLGWDVVLRSTAEGLVVDYVKKPKDAPWSFRPD